MREDGHLSPSPPWKDTAQKHLREDTAACTPAIGPSAAFCDTFSKDPLWPRNGIEDDMTDLLQGAELCPVPPFICWSPDPQDLRMCLFGDRFCEDEVTGGP